MSVSENGTVINVKGAVYHNLLKCFMVSLHYDFKEKKLLIYMEPGNCVDRAGAIELAGKLDLGCEVIETFDGTDIDTGYAIVGGEWVMFNGDGLESEDD